MNPAVLADQWHAAVAASLRSPVPNKIVHWSEFNLGSHFAAMEAPDLLIADVREFFRPLR